jgi:DNA-binding PadR family transcriptional regulator
MEKKMKLISRIEELILVSIWRLEENAFGLAILDELQRVTGRSWLSGSVYASLSRLLQQGYVEAIEGEPTPERGGRRKIFYRVTRSGQKALNTLMEVHSSLWTGLSPFKLNGKE